MSNFIKFAKPEEVKMPKGGLVFDKEDFRDRILGGSNSKLGAIVNETGQWGDFAPTAELQKNRFGDTWWCVTFSYNNIMEFLHKKQYGEDVNRSERYLAIGSGTIQGKGNSKRAVADWGKKNGWVREEECPYTQDMTLAQAYSDLPNGMTQQGQKQLAFYETSYEWLPDNSVTWMTMGLRQSPLQVDVEQYNFNNQEYIINSGSGYFHEVVIFGYESTKCWHVMDSETMQFLKFDWNYDFKNPVVHSLIKKNYMKLYQKIGEKAIYFLNPEDRLLVPFADGRIAGGSLFKIFFGDYKNVPVEKVEVLPFPLADYSITTF